MVTWSMTSSTDETSEAIGRTLHRWQWVGVALVIGALILLVVLLLLFRSMATVSPVRAVIKSIQAGLGHFHVEYRAFPVPPGAPTDKDLEARSRGALLAALLGDNHRKIKFVDFPEAGVRRYGLSQENQEWKLTDHWGEPFYLILDTNSDGEVPNPEASADAEWLKKQPQPATLTTPNAVYSSGPDRDPKTWQDNVTSWR